MEGKKEEEMGGSRRTEYGMREILNESSVQEIHPDVRDCNMDFEIANQRLLAQDDGLAVNCEDTLQEVERKHIKGKEPIEKMQDIGTSAVLDHGSRTTGNLNVGHADPVQISSHDYWNLSLRSKEQAADSATVHVLIPDHLRVSNTEFPDLTFGSLRFETGSAFSTALASDTLNGAGSIAATSGASVGHLDTRNAQHHNDDQHIPAAGAHQADLRGGNNDSHSSSNLELLRPNNREAIPGHEYYSSAPNYVFRNRQQAMQQIQPSAFSSGINPGRDNPAMLFDGYGLRSNPTGPRNAYDILQAMNLLGAAYRQYQASDNQRRSMEKPK